MFNDSGLKIHYIDNYGFLTGVGIGELMMDTFNGIKTPGFDSIHDSFQTAYEAIEKEYSDEKDINRLEKTAVVVSTNNKVFLFSSGFKPNFDCDCVTLHKNTLDILFPLDILEAEQQNIRSLNVSLGHEASIDNVLAVMLDKFKIISSLSKYVSGISSIAILESGNKTPFFTQKKCG